MSSHLMEVIPTLMAGDSFPEHIQIEKLRETHQLGLSSHEVQMARPGTKLGLARELLLRAEEARLRENYGIAAALEYIPDSNRIKNGQITLDPNGLITIPYNQNEISNPIVVFFGANNLAHGDPRAHAESQSIAAFARTQMVTTESVFEINNWVYFQTLSGTIQVVEAAQETLAIAYQLPGDRLIMNTSLSPCPKCAVEIMNLGVDAVHIANPDLFAGTMHPTVEAYLRFKLEGNFDAWFNSFQQLMTPDHIDLLKPFVNPAILDYLYQISHDIPVQKIIDRPWVAMQDLWNIMFDEKHIQLGFCQSKDQNQPLWLPDSMLIALARVFDDHRVFLDRALKDEKLMKLSNKK